MAKTNEQIIAECKAIATARRKALAQANAKTKHALWWSLVQAKDYDAAKNVKTREAARVARTGVPKPDPRRGQPRAPIKPKAPEPVGRPARGGTIGMNGRSAKTWHDERLIHWHKTGNWLHPDDDK